MMCRCADERHTKMCRHLPKRLTPYEHEQLDGAIERMRADPVMRVILRRLERASA